MATPPSLRAYRLLTTGLFYSAFPPFWVYTRISGRHRYGLGQRLGAYPASVRRRPDDTAPRLWLHAASVGEVGAAVPILRALQRKRPDCEVIVTTTTETGNATGRRLLGEQVVCLMAPLDFPVAVNRALRTVAPDLLVCLETELWPALLAAARQRGTPAALVNGRISERSIGGYRRVGPLMRQAMAGIQAFSMIGAGDAERIRSLGAPAGRVTVNGNAKFDGLLEGQADDPADGLRQRFRIRRNTPVFIAGSTRRSEEAHLIEALVRMREVDSSTLLIIAPRHLARTAAIRRMVRSHGMACQLRSRLGKGREHRTAPVVILDTIGELRSAYAIATLAYGGGSLVPLGGQNILEAAAWGVPVLYGPSMEDFRDARDLLERARGGVPVADGRELAERAVSLLKNPSERRRIGRAARYAVGRQQGAAERHAAVISGLLPGGTAGGAVVRRQSFFISP